MTTKDNSIINAKLLQEYNLQYLKENNDLITLVKKETANQLILSGVFSTFPQDPIVLARYMHDVYEILAKNNDWNTQQNCKVDFSDLPIGNKNTMILLASKLILDFGVN